MSITFENQGTNTYLVYEIGANDELDTMSLGMLTNNSIPGFAATSFTQMDATKYIKYNVSAKVSVKQLFSGPVNKKRLVGVFSGVVDAMLSAEDYMLDSDNMLLDLEYIFADVSTCETVLICLPVMNGKHKNPEISVFFKNIIFNTQFDQTENCDHVAQILNYLNSNPVLSLVDFKELLEKISKKNEPVKAGQPMAPSNEPARPAAVNPAPKQPAVVQPAAVQPVASNPAPDVNATPQMQIPVKPKHEDLKFGANYAAAAHPAVPAKVEKNVPAPDVAQAKDEKQMSMFYLLQHYNKENAAIYKSQQEAKKAKKSETKTSGAKQAQKKASAKQVNPAFAVPGQQQSVPAAFAVPGQQQSAPASFAVPGQKQTVAPSQKPVQPVMKTVQPAAPKMQPTPAYQQPVPVSGTLNFGETTVLGGNIGETTVLGVVAEENKVNPHLIRIRNNEKIPLNKPVYRIGKERSYVDYFIGDNTAISRSHANIVNRDNEFFVVDTNSTNHTYVNGGMIPSNVETKLTHGTKIRLANEDFEFKLY